jgi:uncharacterized protein YggE
MMKATIISIAIFITPIVVNAQGFTGQEVITVTGSAVVKVVPDQIYLRIQLSEKQKNRIDLDTKERRLIAELKKINIDTDKDLAISELANNYRSLLFSDDNLVVSKEYVLLVRDTKTGNQVVTLLDHLEISNVKVDHLDHLKLEEFKSECVIKAIKAAKVKAEDMTKAIGQSIGRAVYVEEVKPEKPKEPDQRFAFKAEVSTSHDWFITDLDFKEIKIEYSVLAKFELK